METYRRLVDVLEAHPELQPARDEMRAAALAPVYDRHRHEAALAAWAIGLADAAIKYEPAPAFIGFTARVDVLDPEEGGGVEDLDL